MKHLLIGVFVVLLFFGIGLIISCSDSGDDDADDDDTGDDDTGEFSCDGDVCTDPNTGLMWQNSDDSDYQWNLAEEYCQKLDLGSYSDWRLPTISELRSLIVECPDTQTGGACEVSDSCLSDDCWTGECFGCDSYKGPGPLGRYWPAELRGDGYEYWSSSLESPINSSAWYIFFPEAYISADMIHDGKAVRCVR